MTPPATPPCPAQRHLCYSEKISYVAMLKFSTSIRQLRAACGVPHPLTARGSRACAVPFFLRAYVHQCDCLIGRPGSFNMKNAISLFLLPLLLLLMLVLLYRIPQSHLLSGLFIHHPVFSRMSCAASPDSSACQHCEPCGAASPKVSTSTTR